MATLQVDQPRGFVATPFDANVIFDGDGYPHLEFGSNAASLQFMAPQAGQAAGNPADLTCNFNVDAPYQVLVARSSPCRLTTIAGVGAVLLSLTRMGSCPASSATGSQTPGSSPMSSHRPMPKRVAQLSDLILLGGDARPSKQVQI